MRKIKDITGRRVGQAVAIEPYGLIGKNVHWLCLCDCGNRFVCRRDKIVSGNKNTHCGCVFRDAIKRKQDHPALLGLYKYHISRAWNIHPLPPEPHEKFHYPRYEKGDRVEYFHGKKRELTKGTVVEHRYKTNRILIRSDIGHIVMNWHIRVVKRKLGDVCRT